MVWRSACARMIFPVETPPMEGGEYATFLMPRIGTVRRLSFSSSPQIGGSVLDPHPHTPGTPALDPSGYIYIYIYITYDTILLHSPYMPSSSLVARSFAIPACFPYIHPSRSSVGALHVLKLDFPSVSRPTTLNALSLCLVGYATGTEAENDR